MSTPTRPEWESIGSAPSLEAGELHVWRFALDRAPCRPDWLDLNERSRRKGFANAMLRARYCAARTALRRLLASYLGTTPGQVVLETGSQGKPRLAGPQAVRFNLSHSEDWGLLVFSGFCDVGVDLEAVRRIPNAHRIAQRVFDSESLHQLAESGFEEKTFTRLWTRLEARQKCLGHGIFGIPVSVRDVGSLNFEPLSGFLGSVAWSDPDVEPGMRFFTLDR